MGDGAELPRVYRYSLQARLAYSACGLLIALLGAFCAAMPLTEWPGADREILVGVGVLLAALGIAGPLGLWRVATILRADRIESRGYLETRSMLRRDIVGYRHKAREYGASAIVLSSPSGELEVGVYHPDQHFHDWFEGIPDLDARDRKKAMEEALADPILGSTRAERRARLMRAKALLRWPNIIGWAVGVWAFVHPEPYRIAILASVATPILGVLVIWFSRGAVGFASGPRADVTGLMTPAAALFLRAFLDLDIVDWPWTLLMAGVLGVVGAAAMLWKDPASRKFKLTTLGIYWVGAAIFAWAAVGEANMLLDRSEAKIFRIPVLDKTESHGKTTTFEFKLPEWGPARGGDQSVDEALYKNTQVGDVVCSYLHAGKLGLRWFVISECPHPKR